MQELVNKATATYKVGGATFNAEPSEATFLVVKNLINLLKSFSRIWSKWRYHSGNYKSYLISNISNICTECNRYRCTACRINLCNWFGYHKWNTKSSS